MGLISKIEDKLSGSSSSNSNKLEKSNYDSSTGSTGTSSKLQHPISSSTGGTYGSSTGSAPSSYPQDTSGYTSTAKDRMPGSYVTENEDHIPTSSTTTQGPTHTTTTSTRTDARQPYDPYSSKGQETAARAGTTGYGGSRDQDYGRTAGTTGYGTSRDQDYSRTTADDPSLARSRDGGIMNQTSDPRYSDQRYDDSRYGTQQTSSASPTTSSHHYGRDAAMVGGAGAVGAGGVGAYELGKDHPSSQPLTSGSGQPQYQDASYMNQAQPMSSQPQQTSRDAAMTGGAMQPGAMGSQSQGGTASGMAGESGGLPQAKKMGGAYEAGYRDAMEHMQKEMAQKGSGSAF